MQPTWWLKVAQSDCGGKQSKKKNTEINPDLDDELSIWYSDNCFILFRHDVTQSRPQFVEKILRIF